MTTKKNTFEDENFAIEAYYWVTPYRVEKKGLYILYVKFDDGKVYGGVRYNGRSEEDDVMRSIIYEALKGFSKPTGMQEIELHRSLGRNVEELQRVVVRFNV